VSVACEDGGERFRGAEGVCGSVSGERGGDRVDAAGAGVEEGEVAPTHGGRRVGCEGGLAPESAAEDAELPEPSAAGAGATSGGMGSMSPGLLECLV